MVRARPSAAPVALSVGGSILSTDESGAEYVARLADLLRARGREFPLVVTTGGGRTAREYIRLGRTLGLTEFELDEIGIDVTRLHARLLAARIGPPTPAVPPTTVAEAVRELRHGSPVVMGGTEPGHTTDGVAALVAARLRAVRFVNATREAGLFDSDPRRHPGARRIDRLDFPAFREIVHRHSPGEAGQEFLFDRLAADTLERARIPIAIVDGRDLENLDAALRGAPFRGTRIGSD